jgi:hypothetical protein
MESATPTPFKIRADATSSCISVDGQDITEGTAGFELVGGFGEATHLVIHRMPGAGVVEGLANVTILPPAEAAAAAVRELDPGAVREALSSLSLSMADDPHAATLEVIAGLLEAT